MVTISYAKLWTYFIMLVVWFWCERGGGRREGGIFFCYFLSVNDHLNASHHLLIRAPHRMARHGVLCALCVPFRQNHCVNRTIEAFTSMKCLYSLIHSGWPFHLQNNLKILNYAKYFLPFCHFWLTSKHSTIITRAQWKLNAVLFLSFSSPSFIISNYYCIINLPHESERIKKIEQTFQLYAFALYFSFRFCLFIHSFICFFSKCSQCSERERERHLQ